MKKPSTGKANLIGIDPELLTPIVRPKVINALLTPERISEIEARRLSALRYRKLDILLKHYGLSWDDVSKASLQLLIKVANDWIRGFQIIETVPRGRGAPTRKTEGILIDLYERVELIRKEKGLPLSQAADTFLKRNKTDPIWAGKAPRYVENCYRGGKKLSEQIQDQQERLNKLNLSQHIDHAFWMGAGFGGPLDPLGGVIREPQKKGT